jgi:hypothetical protein
MCRRLAAAFPLYADESFEEVVGTVALGSRCFDCGGIGLMS